MLTFVQFVEIHGRGTELVCFGLPAGAERPIRTGTEGGETGLTGHDGRVQSKQQGWQVGRPAFGLPVHRQDCRADCFLPAGCEKNEVVSIESKLSAIVRNSRFVRKSRDRLDQIAEMSTRMLRVV